MIAPALALEKIPKRVRVKDSDIAAFARHLNRMVPNSRIEQVADWIYKLPTHDGGNENVSGTLSQANSIGDSI